MDNQLFNHHLLDCLEEDVDGMDYENVDDQKFCEIFQSLESEVSNSQQMDKSEVNQQQQLDHIQSLEDQVSNSQQMHNCALNQQQQLDHIQSLEDQVPNSQQMHKSALNQQQQLDHIQSPEDQVSNSLKLGKSALNQHQLLDHIQSLEDQGFVDKHFRICYSLKEHQGPSFFLNVVNVFLRDARIVMRKLTKSLHSLAVDFDALYVSGVKLKGSSSCIGACKLSNACAVFIHAVDKKSKNECLRALGDIKQEYKLLDSKLESIIELEKEIVPAESSTRKDRS